MTVFTTSMMSSTTTTNLKNRGNSLVVVVSKAQELRNVCKLDKQSPFVTIRLQDQEESTKVVSRGGQTPKFNDELWFNLDGVEDRILHISVYHQKKKDTELVCFNKLDFTPALRRNQNEGYDGWFDLKFGGKFAGRIYLEMTYYPKEGVVPVDTENVGRSEKMMKQSIINESKLYNKNAMHLPDLNDRLNESTKNTKSRHTLLNDDDYYDDSDSDRDMEHDEKEHKHAENAIDDKDHQNAHSKNNGWMSFLDNKVKLPTFLNNPFGNSTNFNENNIRFGKKEKTSEIKRKLENPQLVEEAPKNLFIGSSDEEEIEDENKDIYKKQDKVKNIETILRESVTSRQERVLNEKPPLRPSEFQQTFVDSDSDDEDKEINYSYNKSGNNLFDDDSDDESLKMGQSVDFRTSTNSQKRPFSRSTLSVNEEIAEDEMRKSFKNRPLPQMPKNRPSRKPRRTVTPMIPMIDSDDDIHDNVDEDNNDIEIPPPPPKHVIPTFGSLFDSVSKEMSESIGSFKLQTGGELPKTAPTTHDNSPMSWRERRRLNK